MFVNESIVRKYKAELTEEVEPQILELIERAKKGVKALERKHHTMKTKVCAFILCHIRCFMLISVYVLSQNTFKLRKQQHTEVSKLVWMNGSSGSCLDRDRTWNGNS